MKKIIILIVILAFAAVVSVPFWSGKVAEKAFENIEDPRAPVVAVKAIKMKMRIDDFASAQSYAERAYIYFSDKTDNMPFFIYNAAVSAKKLNKPELAIFWYDRFLKECPRHEWEDQAKIDMQKLKEMHENK